MLPNLPMLLFRSSTFSRSFFLPQRLVSDLAECRLTFGARNNYRFVIDESNKSVLEVDIENHDSLADLKSKMSSFSDEFGNVEFFVGNDFVLDETTTKMFDFGAAKLDSVDNEKVFEVANDVLQWNSQRNMDRFIEFYRQLKRSEESLESLTLRKTELISKLIPYEKTKSEIEIRCNKHLNKILWSWLGLLSFQMGALARWTWYEYSWDVVEPMTYFIGYSAVIGCYSFFVLTDKDFDFTSLSQSIYLNKFHKVANKLGFDAIAYNEVCKELENVEGKIKLIRNGKIQLITENELSNDFPYTINQLLFARDQ